MKNRKLFLRMVFNHAVDLLACYLTWGWCFDLVVRVIYVSFGGLLMMLSGDPANTAKLDLDQRLFLLIRKV